MVDFVAWPLYSELETDLNNNWKLNCDLVQFTTSDKSASLFLNYGISNGVFAGFSKKKKKRCIVRDFLNFILNLINFLLMKFTENFTYLFSAWLPRKCMTEKPFFLLKNFHHLPACYELKE